MNLIRITTILLLLIQFKAYALIEVDITRGNLNPLPIAVSPLSTDKKSQSESEKILNIKDIGAEISVVVEKNLKNSGLFNPLDKDSFLQKPDIAHLKPRFEDWKLIKAQALITGKVDIVEEKLRVEFRMWDVLAAKEMLAIAFTTVPTNWRRVGHIITDKVYERLTGEKGYFDTRIIYVAEQGPKTQRIKKLAIMDQDGFNTKYLTLGNELVLTPRFNPTNQMVTYLSYFKNLPRVYLLDIETGIQEVVGDFPGMTFAPRFSPDGSQIVMSYSDPKVGNSEIYILDLQTRISKRITDNSAIDVSASFAPGGQKIVFNSDRSGRRHLYIIDINGKNIKRISREAGSYYTPVWSPRGDMIAFTKQEGGQFYIGVMETDGTNERMIAKSFHVEGPTWSPNGRYLMYFKEERTAEDGSGGESSLYSIDLTGSNERKIITPLGGSDPAWSPLMH